MSPTSRRSRNRTTSAGVAAVAGGKTPLQARRIIERYGNEDAAHAHRAGERRISDCPGLFSGTQIQIWAFGLRPRWPGWRGARIVLGGAVSQYNAADADRGPAS
jgi:hypothetical protein